LLRKLSEKTGVGQRDFFIIFILLFNVFTWWYVIPIMIDDVLSVVHVTHAQNFIIWVSYYIAILGSSIVGSILSNKISRLNFLYLWIISGVITSSLPALLKNFTAANVLIIGILFGVSFGLGMPSCLAYFADCTLIENRGIISGIIFSVTNLSAPLFIILFGMFNLMINSIILAVWRASGLIILFLKPREKIVLEKEKNVSFKSVLHHKSFILYFIAWLMFLFIDRLEWPILESIFGDFYYLMMAPLIGSLSVFIAGLLSDRIGRKRMILYGFVSLGIAYAIIGIAPAPVRLFSWYFFLTIESISWGILWVIFILILWGDLSQYGGREKFYVIGEAPFFLTNILGLISAPYVTLIPETSAFSLASFFLFLAVLPLLQAPETLPEKKIELRRLRKYVEKAKRLQQEYGEKAIEK